MVSRSLTLRLLWIIEANGCPRKAAPNLNMLPHCEDSSCLLAENTACVATAATVGMSQQGWAGLEDQNSTNTGGQPGGVSELRPRPLKCPPRDQHPSHIQAMSNHCQARSTCEQPGLPPRRFGPRACAARTTVQTVISLASWSRQASKTSRQLDSLV